MGTTSIQCKICGRLCKSNLSLTSHITGKHNISSKDYYDKFYKKEDYGICVICGKPTRYKNISLGYTKYCSSKCINNDKNVIEKANTNRIKTFNEKYNVDNASHIPGVKIKLSKINSDNSKERIEKSKTTCIKNFGVENPFQSEKCKEKIKNTKKSKYKDENYSNRDKAVLTNNLKIELFEKENNCTQLAKIQRETSSKFRQYIQDKYPTIINENIYYISNEFLPDIEQDKESFNNRYIRSIKQKEIYDYITSIYNGKVLYDTKSIIYPLELDIYIPEKKIGIEYNGVHWHTNKDINYHYNKSKICRDNNILLLHIWSYDWETYKDAYKILLKYLLNIDITTINFSECIYKEVSNEELKSFAQDKIINKDWLSTLYRSNKLGLFYKNTLIKIICYDKYNHINDILNDYKYTIISLKLPENLNGYKYIIHTDLPIYNTNIFSIIGTQKGKMLYKTFCKNKPCIDSGRLILRVI